VLAMPPGIGIRGLFWFDSPGVLQMANDRLA
jgi:hypothetical protein